MILLQELELVFGHTDGGGRKDRQTWKSKYFFRYLSQNEIFNARVVKPIPWVPWSQPILRYLHRISDREPVKSKIPVLLDSYRVPKEYVHTYLSDIAWLNKYQPEIVDCLP